MKTGRIVLAVFLFITILFFPSRVLQAIAFLYLTLLGLSFAYSRLASRYVVLRRKELLLRAYRFEPMEIALILENRSPLPVHYLTVLDMPNHFFASEPGKFLLALGPWEKRTLSYKIKSQNRGEYMIGPAVLKGSDPLGLFPWRKIQQEVEKLIVYPEILPLNLAYRTGLPAGNISVDNRIYEDVTRYRSLREYLPGDDFRRISWKASAKTGRLYSMDYLPMLYAPVLILLNLNREDYPLRYRYHRVERAAVLAASMVAHFLALKQEIGLIAAACLKDGGGIPVAEIRGTHGHGTTIMEMLARMDVSPDSIDFVRLPFDCGIEIPVQTRLEVITPQLTAEQWGLLRTLKGKGCTVELFLIGANPSPQQELLARECRVFHVPDYGNELVHQQ